jgi:ketosteroid isomerase-like protein
MSPREAARRWADTWRAAWEALDPDPIVALYAADAVFSTEPFREPYRGPAGVRSYVERVFAEEASPRVWTSEPIVEGNRASVSWWAALLEEGIETTLAGTSVLRFDADGLVASQWDSWNAAPGRRDPPGGSLLTDSDT